VASSVNLIAAQRLIRKICTTCKEPLEVPEQALIDIGFSKTDAKALKLFRGKGCERCGGTGFKGRIALFEVMDVDEGIRELILSGGSANELRQQSLENGMMSLRSSGLQKIREGVTTLEEVLRETVA
jgi:type IV pilus assembly protein PilB